MRQTETLNMRVDAETIRKLRALAEHEQRSMAAVVRILIHEKAVSLAQPPSNEQQRVMA